MWVQINFLFIALEAHKETIVRCSKSVGFVETKAEEEIAVPNNFSNPFRKLAVMLHF